MFAIIFMCIALLDELLFWMRCQQLRREAREAAERLIVVLEELNYTDSQQESRPPVWIECKNNWSVKEENRSKEMGTRLVYDYQQQKWIPYVSDPDSWYQHLLDVIDGYADRDSQGRYIFGSGQKYREVKEMRQKEKLVVNLVNPVAQALEMAESDLKRKREESIKGGERKTATKDWNSLRY